MTSIIAGEIFTPPMSMPKLIMGTSCLGNLYQDIGYDAKKEILAEIIHHSKKCCNDHNLVLDSAGKYGCGLALESIGLILKDLQVPPSDVRISNKLGWRRIPLDNDNPSSCVNMEPGVWMNLEYDAEMDISYNGMLACFEEGNKLLGNYSASLVSVHDPDDYIKDGASSAEKERRKLDILDAYRCLYDLKSQQKVDSVGIGVKNPEIIEYLLEQGVEFDWVMIAGVLTPHTHSMLTRTLLKKLHSKSIQVINSAVFNSGFLVGEDYYNYVKQDCQQNASLYKWRDDFFRICSRHHFSPAHVCVQFSFLFVEVQSIALNACRLDQVALNFKNTKEIIPRDHDIWKELRDEQLIAI